MFDIRSLRTFVAIVENRGFAQAAEVLNYSQPTVSAQIAGLETELNAKLFFRDRRPVRLTPAGETLLGHARMILNEVEAAREGVSEFLGSRGGRVKLGTYPSLTAGYVPKLLRAFGGMFPLVRIELIELSGLQMERAALAGEVDIFVRQATPVLSIGVFESKPLWREPFKAVMPRGHILAAQDGPLAPSDLLKHDLITTDRDQDEGVLSHPFWHALRYLPRIAFQVSQPQSVLELVRAELGVGMVTELGWRTAQTGTLVARNIDHPQAFREVRAFWLRNRALSYAARSLLDFILTRAHVPPHMLEPD